MILETTFFFFLSLQTSAKDYCADVPELLRPREAVASTPSSIKSSLARNSGVQLTDDQAAVVSKMSQNNKDLYSAGDIAKENQELKKAGLDSEQINKLRASGVLGKSLTHASPTKVDVQTLGLRSLDKSDITGLKKGEKRNYVITQNGQMQISPEAVKMSDDTILVSNEVASNGLPNRSAVIETGELFFDSTKKQYFFQPKHAVDVSTDETAILLERVNSLDPGSKVLKGAPPPNTPVSKAIECLDVLSAQNKGKNFVLDRVIADNAVTTTAILNSELMGAGRLSEQKGQEVVIADLIGTNINSIIGASIGKHLVTKDMSLATSLGTRAGVGLSMIELQKQVYQQVLTDDAKERSETIANFDRAHFGARLFVNHYFDKFVVNTLPKIIFESCQKNSKMQIFVGPRAIRLYERTGSAMLYYGARDAIIGE